MTTENRGAGIHTLRRDITEHEEMIEELTTTLRGVKIAADRHIEEAGALIDGADAHDLPMLRAMQRRAENLRDLACKMHAATVRF